MRANAKRRSQSFHLKWLILIIGLAFTGLLGASINEAKGVTDKSNNIKPLDGGPLVISNFLPTSGPPQTDIMITGSGFTNVLTVKISGIKTVFQIRSDSTIIATVPTGAQTSRIVLISPDGKVKSDQHFTVNNGPAINGFSPFSAPVGSSIAIFGVNLNKVKKVNFNGTDATNLSVTGPNSLRVIVPTGSISGPITVSGSNGTATSFANFLVAPILTSFTPTDGLVGDKITISGLNLDNVTNVKFAGDTASGTTGQIDNNSRTTTSLTVTVPNGAISGPITINSPGNQSISTDTFQVEPQIAYFSPSQGAPGTQVNISGSALNGATSVQFNGVAAPSFTINNSTSLTAIVPPTATNSGSITITTPSGIATSGTTFNIPAMLGTFMPASGLVGTTVVLNGTNFGELTSVKFAGDTASGVTVKTISSNSDKIATVTVPAGAITGPIQLVSKGGSTFSTDNFTIMPKIDSFTPGEGGMGATVTISGSGFTEVQSVTFNNIKTDFTVLESTQLTATVPRTGSGPIVVTTAAGSAKSQTMFIIKK